MAALFSTRSLLGRDREIGVVDDVLSHITERGGALVIRGGAGIGKSALIAAARTRAADRAIRVLSTTGVQSEAKLSFAGLHQLLRPILGEAGDLPPPQRDALWAAFAIMDAPAPDLFLIALAALELLAGTAAHTPLLLIAEDAHWLDHATIEVLTFVARRLEQEPIVLLAAVREGIENALANVGLPELPLERLDETSSGTLLDAWAPDLVSQVRERLLGEAAGNPLALEELPAALASEQRHGETALPSSLSLTTRLERAFLEQASGLSASAQTVLLVAAVDDGSDVAEVMLSASILQGSEGGEEALASAVSAGLVRVDGAEMSFRHPLVRSGLQWAAGPARRRAAHAALAEVLADDPDRSIWHRAASVDGPNEMVASELEMAAVRAQRRGAMAVAVAALERAAELAHEPVRRRERLLRALAKAVELGRRDLVTRLIGNLEVLDLGTVERGRMTWAQEMIDPGNLKDAMRDRSLILMAGCAREEGDTDLALDLLWLVAVRCWWANHDQEMRDLVVAEAERAGDRAGDPRMLAILAHAAAIERGSFVTSRMSDLAPEGGLSFDATRLLGTAAFTIGAFELAAGFLSNAVAGLRPQGQLSQLARALIQRAWVAIHLGEWNLAAQDLDEGERLARETSQLRWEAAAQATRATLAALRGEQDLAQSLSATAEKILLPMGASFMLAFAQWARGLVALGVGDHAEAFDHLRRMVDPADPAYHYFVHCWAIADLAEAGAHTGQQTAARALVEDLASLAKHTPSPWFHAALRYARALVANDEEAEVLFQLALDADMARWPFYRARLQLAYGTWLRRERRAAQSRAPLRAAREAFDALGAVSWGERARQELRASGETSRKRTRQAWDELSPQELQIARMAAQGLSNREIGQRLFLSHRTVGSHLYRIFPKLGIAFRAQLRDVMPSQVPSFD